MTIQLEQNKTEKQEPVEAANPLNLEGNFSGREELLTSANLAQKEQLPEAFLAEVDSDNPFNLAGNGFLHNHSVVNRIQVQNNTNETFTVIHDYTSNGEMSHKEKEVNEVKPGETTPDFADVDVILPLNENTVFHTTGGYKTNPGSAIRTSRRGDVIIMEGNEPNTFLVHVSGGFSFATGRVLEIPDPRNDENSPFHQLFE